MDAATLYDEDIYAWAMNQAEALRRIAAERPDLSNAVDWVHLAEEIEDLGSEKLFSVESSLTQLLSHLVVLTSTELIEPRRHWLLEVEAFRLNARRRYRPAMRRALDLDEVWRSSLKLARGKLAAQNEPMLDRLPARCPLEIERLLAGAEAEELLADFVRALDAS